MVTLHTHRNDAEYVLANLFPYIKFLKQTNLRNVANHSHVDDARLTVKLINSILDDVELLIRKKIVNTSGRNIKIKMSDAAAITLYKTLLNIPLEKEKMYLHGLRQAWIESLDGQIYSMEDLAQLKR